MKFSVVALAVFMASFSASGVSGETLRLAVFEYPPFLQQNAEGHGLEPSLVTAAFDQVGVEVEYSFYPAARAHRVARLGDYDGTLGWVHSEQRQQDFLFSEPVAEAPLVFFHLREFRFDWKEYDDLQGLEVGTVIDYYYGSEFHEALEAGKFEADTAVHDLLNLRKLLRERVALTPINRYVGNYMINKHFDSETAEQFTHHPTALKTSVHHLLLPRALEESASRLALFNEGLQKIRDSGEYIRILEKFIEQ